MKYIEMQEKLLKIENLSLVVEKGPSWSRPAQSWNAFRFPPMISIVP